jgi:aspartate aminotransferase-like enzyme
MSLKQIVLKKNNSKHLFTPGPSSLLIENLENIKPCFGRNDLDYENLENNVLSMLKKISNHKHITRLQGSASLAMEIMILNFLQGDILIINTGYYSDRLNYIAKFAKKNFRFINKIDYVKLENANKIKKKYSWILSCVTETSIGYLIPIKQLNKLKIKTGAKLALDATASIGLEDNHHFADVLAYSSCKGLFGLTGASFIAFNKFPKNKISSFNLDLYSHYDKKMTGPYHTIYSLYKILKNYRSFKFAVLKNKEKFCKLYKDDLIFPKENQPLLCTQSKKKVRRLNKNTILYSPRSNIQGSIICHLGEVHLKTKASGKILENISFY